jgi:hypothetical protein
VPNPGTGSKKESNEKGESLCFFSRDQRPSQEKCHAGPSSQKICQAGITFACCHRLREEQAEIKRREEAVELSRGIAPIISPEEGGPLETHLHGLIREQVTIDLMGRQEFADLLDEWDGETEAERLTEDQTHLETVRFLPLLTSGI